MTSLLEGSGGRRKVTKSYRSFFPKILVGRQLIPLCRLLLFSNFSSVSFITCESISFFDKFYQWVSYYLRVAN